jgi:hypothetical protein
LLHTVISGGQTGADQGALAAARELGLKTGGTAPLGWLTEDGPNEALLRGFGLNECSEPGYPARTKCNVVDADGTLIVGSYQTTGSALTAKLATEFGKPLFTAPYPGPGAVPGENIVEEFMEWLVRRRVGILNAAGNRESQSPGIAEFTRRLLLAALR